MSFYICQVKMYLFGAYTTTLDVQVSQTFP